MASWVSHIIVVYMTQNSPGGSYDSGDGNMYILAAFQPWFIPLRLTELPP